MNKQVKKPNNKTPTINEIQEILTAVKKAGIDWSKKGDPKFDRIMKKHGSTNL